MGKAFGSARSVLLLTPVDCVENPASAFTQHVIFFFLLSSNRHVWIYYFT